MTGSLGTLKCSWYSRARSRSSSASRPGSGRHARFQLTPQGYGFPAGHQVKVEVTANDMPYLQQSNLPAVVQVAAMSITLLLHEPPGTVEVTPAPMPTSPRPTAPTGRLPATGRDASPLRWWAAILPGLVGLGGLRRAVVR